MFTTVTEKLYLQLIDESLCQRLHCVGQDRVNAEKMISGLNDIIDFNVFASCEDSVFLIQYSHLIAGQTIACHTPATIDHVNLQILVEAAILFAIALLDKSFK